MESKQIELVAFIKILKRGQLSELIGSSETEQIEFKAQPYDFGATTKNNRFELAKDGNTCAHAHAQAAQLADPIANARNGSQGFAEMIRIQQEAGHQDSPISRRTRALFCDTDMTASCRAVAGPWRRKAFFLAPASRPRL